MFFRFAAICLLAILLYAGYYIWVAHDRASSYANPSAEFLILAEGNQSEPEIVEFLNYGCEICVKTHLALREYVQTYPGARFVVRPVPVMPETAFTAAERVLAAGLQGKFEEVDKALSEYSGIPDEKFYREIASLYEVDYDLMLKDAQEEKVHDYGKENLEMLLRLGAKTTPALLVGKTFYQPTEALTLQDIMRIVTTEKNKSR